MKEFDFGGRSKFAINWSGNKHECICPSQKQVVEFAKKARDLKEDDPKLLDLGKDFLCDLGLPGEVYDEMEPAQIKSIMEHIGAKKN